MVSGGKDGGIDDGIHFVRYLHVNRLAAYVLLVMVLMHFSNQFDR